MRSTQDGLLSDDPFYTVVGDNIQGSYFPDTSGATASSTTTTGSVMSVTAGGITINLILDAAAQAAPDSFKNGLQQAVAILAANITDKITVNINIDYSGKGGGASAGPDNGYYETYAWTHSELVNNASAGDTAFNSLPAGLTIQGQSSVAVWDAQLKLWGVLGSNDTTTDDASANFSTDINPNLLVGVALHELTHAMGRVPYGAAPDVFDFYRFTSPGVHLFQGGAIAPAAYFSLDNGATKIADYGQNSDPSDFLNSGVQGPNDPFNEFYTSTTIQGLTATDLKQLDALGFHLAINAPTTIESYGSTSLVQAGSNYFMDPVAGGGGPSLKYGGTSITVGQWGGWVPIGAEATGSGYEVAWKLTGADQYTVWNTDANGNDTVNNIGTVSGSSTALESLETSFHQDINGDGVIGVPASTIESYGATSLVQSGNYYFVNPTAGGTGPTLKYGGTSITVGQWGGWAPIGAEATGSGYEVAWKLAGADQYTVWNTDANGNDTVNNIGTVSGSSTALESLETSFHQDLNGDGVIGMPALSGATIESYGATTLVQSGNNYFVNPTAGGTGPTLKYLGAPITVGQWGGWVPIGAEATGSGYEVAWKLTGADQYTVWNTDANGNDTVNNIGTVPGSSTALESLEPTFHQDLNGDGTIGVPSPSNRLVVTVANDGFTFASGAGTPSSGSVVSQSSVGGNAVVHVDTNGTPASVEPVTDVLSYLLAHYQDSLAGFILPH